MGTLVILNEDTGAELGIRKDGTGYHIPAADQCRSQTQHAMNYTFVHMPVDENAEYDYDRNRMDGL